MARSSPVMLRKAQASDISAIVALEQVSFHDTGQAFSRQQVAYLVRRAKGLVLVAVDDGQIVGWIVALRREQNERRIGRIYTVAVDPRAQGQGIGRHLLQAALEKLKQQGVTKVFLEVSQDNHGAIALYGKLGFVTLGELTHYYARHQHALRMQRILN